MSRQLYKIPDSALVCSQRKSYFSFVGKEFRAVFVSTVRSRHLLRSMGSEREGEFGFLSEEKLLNTALTRAKSWIGVVGDPVALCSIGKCSSIWKMFLKDCEKLGSMIPKELKLEDVWMQANQITSSTKPLVYVPTNEFNVSQQSGIHSYRPAERCLSKLFDEERRNTAQPIDTGKRNGLLDVVTFQEWSLDYQMEPDELAKVSHQLNNIT